MPPTRNVSGGVLSSRPSQKGHSSSSASVGSSANPASAPGRRRRFGATTTRRPESGSVRRSRAVVAAPLEERADQVDRGREDDRRRIRAASDLEQRLEVAQLERDRMLLDYESRVLQPLRA